MNLVTLTIIATQKNKILWQEKNRKNILHPQGKQLLLSATFLRENSAIPLPNSWFIGLDNRLTIGKADTLAEVAKYEPKSQDYARIMIGEDGNFTSFWQESKEEEPPEFTINATADFSPNEDWGIVRNFFLASVNEGTKGILVSSIPLKKPRDMDSETFFTVEFLLNLQDSIRKIDKK